MNKSILYKHLDIDLKQKIQDHINLINYHLILKRLPKDLQDIIKSYEPEDNTELITKIQRFSFIPSNDFIRNINYRSVKLLIEHLPSLIIETKNIYRLCSWDYKTEITLALMLLKYNPVQLRSNNDKIEISVFNCKIKAFTKETYIISKILQHNGIKIDTHTLYRTNKYMCGFD